MNGKSTSVTAPLMEFLDRAERGELVEAFGSGTAAVVSPIKEIGYHEKAVNVPLLPGEECGPLTKEVREWIADIQYGRVQHGDWSREILDLKN